MRRCVDVEAVAVQPARLKPDREVMEKWGAKVAQMDERQCRATIAQMRQKGQEHWNVNTKCVYGMLRNRLRLLSQRRGLVVLAELAEDERRANELTLAAVAPQGASRVQQGAYQPRWSAERSSRQEWGREQRERRQASFR